MPPQNAFGSSPKRSGLDAGYFTAPVAESLARRNIIGVFGYRRPTKGKPPLRKRAFRYNADTDSYICPAGQSLIYSTTTREGYHTYKSNPTDSQTCPLRPQCTQNQKAERLISRHLYQDAVDNANAVRVSRQDRKLYQRRAETVERSFADAKQHHGHRYARYRGLAKVQMQCFLAAMAQNIKKIALVVWAFLSYLWRQFCVFEAVVKQSEKMTACPVI